MTNTAVFPQGINDVLVQFTSADTTNEKDVFTAGGNGSKVEHIMVASTDTSDRDLLIYISVGAGDFLFGTVKIPANSGNTNLLPAVALLASSQMPWNTDAQGNKYLYVSGGNKIRMAMGTTITAAKEVNVFVQAGDF